MKKFSNQNKILYGIIGLLLIIFIVIIAINYQNIKSKSVEIEKLKTEVSEKNSIIQNLSLDKGNLENELGITIEELEEKEDEFKELNDKTEEIIELISTDEELLQKYSKIFFLNEHYTPVKLSEIDEDFWANPNKPMVVNSKIKKHLENLLEEAKDDDVDLQILSAYRSFGTQASLKYNYLITYGSGANTFSADQGYSEHQLGTTVDFTTPELGSNLSVQFENTDAFKWLTENAYKHGFVMSYPKGNQYYQYEPWHWRFVSKDLARELKRKEIGFYDMDQRKIYNYLQDFFD